MESQQKQTGRLFIVPMDVMMDILRIILKNGLRHHIEGINEKENTILIRVFPNVNSLYGKEAVRNIAEILTDYGYYLTGNSSFSPQDEDDEDGFVYNQSIT
jgi:hypothetical protein